jgi:DnaK suppressor protein
VAKPDLGEVAAAKTEGQDGHGSEPAARAGAQAVDAHGAAGGGHAEAGRAHRRRDVKKDAAGGDQPAPPGPAERELFLLRQRELLVAERNNYTRQAEELRAQADALALEHEPGDVQFDEEGGEGGTANVDREIDLQLSAQARAAIEDIDAALAKIEAGTYGLCESCGTQIPEARLEALPQAKLCVRCKSGGLAARRH